MMLWSIEGNMRRAVSQIEEEGILFLLSNERNGMPGTVIEMVEGVGNDAGLGAFAFEIEIAVAGCVAVFVVKVIEAVLADCRSGSEMPFADLRSGLADFLQPFGDGEFLVETVERLLVGFDTKAVLVFPDQESGS